MRVLIADRNAWLLESIARSFADQFSIQTATSQGDCNDLLRRGAFDLAVISEKLADGAGLDLLGQIVRDSPDTLRVFAASRSRLELLQGKLGCLGLFRTLSYPIDPQALRTALSLARAALQADVPALQTNVPASRTDMLAPQTDVPATQANAPAPQVVVYTPPPAPARTTVERISLNSGDAVIALNVPKMIASIRKARRPDLTPAPRPMPVARNNQQAAPKSEVSQVAAVPRPATPTHLSSPSDSTQHPTHSSDRKQVDKAPVRTKVLLGVTVLVTFLVTTLTLNRVDASAHDMRGPVPHLEKEQPEISPPPPNLPPVEAKPMFGPAQTVARRTDPTKVDAAPANPQLAATAPPIADPSTFSSEAYEPIYAD